MKGRVGVALGLGGVALLPLVPAMLVGVAGHDLRFHVSSWMELSDAWRAGHAGDGWAALANYRLGDAHLLYYPPVSVWAGAALVWGLGLQAAPAVFAYLCVLLAGATMYHASRWFVCEEDRVTAAEMYMLSPYLVTTSLVRFSAGELLVQAVLPLALLWWWRGVWHEERRAWLLLAAVLGTAWLTNIPAALVLLFTLLPMTAYRAVQVRSAVPLVRMLGAECGAGLLAGFYLAPLWAEQAWFSRSLLVRVPFSGLLLLMPHVGLPRWNLFYVSCWVMALGGAAMLLVCRRGQKGGVWSGASWLAFTLQTPLTLALWNHLPGLKEVVFPYRFLAVMGAALPWVVLRPGMPRRLRYAAYVGIAMLALPVGQHVRMQLHPATHQPGVTALAAEWRSLGYSGVPEWLPTGPDGQPASADFEPPQRLPAASGCGVRMESPWKFTTEADRPCHVLLPVFYFPYWRAWDERGNRLKVTAAEDGRMLVEIPAGVAWVRMEFVARSWLRTWSRGISCAGWLALAAGVWVMRRDPREEARPASYT